MGSSCQQTLTAPPHRSLLLQFKTLYRGVPRNNVKIRCFWAPRGTNLLVQEQRGSLPHLTTGSGKDLLVQLPHYTLSRCQQFAAGDQLNGLLDFG